MPPKNGKKQSAEGLVWCPSMRGRGTSSGWTLLRLILQQRQDLEGRVELIQVGKNFLQQALVSFYARRALRRSAIGRTKDDAADADSPAVIGIGELYSQKDRIDFRFGLSPRSAPPSEVTTIVPFSPTATARSRS